MLWLWSDQFEFMAVLMVFNLWIVSRCIFVPFIQVLIFSSHFPCTIHGLGLFSGTYHNTLLCLSGPAIENNSI